MKFNQRNNEKEKKNVSIRKGDTVVVIAGKDKGKKGKVLFVDADKNQCAVEGVNIVTKHKKARNAQQKSSRDKRPGAIDISNVQILCKCGKATRVAHKEINGKKHRVCAKCGEILDKKYVKVKEKAAEDTKAAEGETEKTAATETKKPLVRREVKHVAESKVKRPAKINQAPNATSTHRKIGV
jgi:large subunit ribosomal protein L24